MAIDWISSELVNCTVYAFILRIFLRFWGRITDRPIREGVTPIKSLQEREKFHRQRVQEPLLRLSEVLTREKFPFLLIKASNSWPQFLVEPSGVSKLEEIFRGEGFFASDFIDWSQAQRKAGRRYLSWTTFHSQDCQHEVVVNLRLFDRWVGTDLVSFQELWERSELVTNGPFAGCRDLSKEDRVVSLALWGMEECWSRLEVLLSLVQALEDDVSWDTVLEISGYRKSLVERAVEFCVHLLHIAHPQGMTHHFRDAKHALKQFQLTYNVALPMRELLLDRSSWSCSSWEAISHIVKGLSQPELRDIGSTKLPESLIGLYRLLTLLREIREWS